MSDKPVVDSRAHAEADELFALYFRLFALMVLTGLTGLLVFGVGYRFFPGPISISKIAYMEAVNLHTWLAFGIVVIGAIGIWFITRSTR